jgi:hypothetical protein
MIILISNPKANRVLVYNEKFEGEKKIRGLGGLGGLSGF